MTIVGPNGLTPDMVDLDEVGFLDTPSTEASIGTFHYPFTGSGNLIATGSCDAANDHSNTCDHNIGFSLDTNDIFTNADEIKFSLTAPNGSYTIKYELVNGDVVLGTMSTVSVTVVNPAAITSAVPITVDASFTPAISSTLARGSEAYLGRTTNYTGPAIGVGDTIKWKVTIDGPGTLTDADIVDLDEVGFKDPGGIDSTVAFHYPFTVSGGNLIATGSCDAVLPSGHGSNPCTTAVGFSLDLNDIFTNADKVKFSLDAPNGTYTIKYELVNAIGDVVLGTMSPVSVTVVDPAVITSAVPSTVDSSFTPPIGSTLDRGTEAFIGRTTTYTGPAIGIGTPDTIKWKVTIDGTSATPLAANMVDLDEVGFNDPGGAGIVLGTYHYPFSAVGGNLVATGSCDAAGDHDGVCDQLVGFSLDTNDVFTNADKIKFNSSAPFGAYTIIYELVNTADGIVLGTHSVSVNVNFDKTIALTSAGQWALVSAPTLLSEAPIVTDDESGAGALLIYENGVFVAPGAGNGEIIKPVSAFYVKTTNTGKIGFRYATISSPTQTSKQLAVGWNLVGTNNAGLAKDEFSSIQTAEAAGMVTLYVPDTNNSRKDSGYTLWEGDANHDLNANPITGLPAKNLSMYDGYWVFMNAAKAFTKQIGL